MNLFRGWIGEKKTTFYLWLSLSKKSYHIFHNLIFPSSNGTTQIDHLIVSVYGLFIVETKNKRAGFLDLRASLAGHNPFTVRIIHFRTH